MALELGRKFSEGAGHAIYLNRENPNYLVKVPKKLNNFSYERVVRDLEEAVKYFQPWIPETSVHPHGKHSYFMEQRLVDNFEHIRPSHLESDVISHEIEEILEANRKAMKDGNIGLDFIGYEGSAKGFLARHKSLKGGNVDLFLIQPALKLAKIAGGVPAKCLDWWTDSNLSPEITNLVIGTRERTNKKIAIVDLSLLHFGSNSLIENVRSTFLENWNKRYLKADFGLDL